MTTFRGEQYDLAYPEGIDGHFWTLARHGVVARLLAGRGRGGLVLDVGCGRGLTVEYLRKAGLECLGVELAGVQPLPAVSAFVFAGQDALTLPDDLRARVSAILLLDVVEHLPEPEAFLRACAERFPSLERVVVTVPARPELWSNYDEFYGHLRRYDRPSLRALLATIGTRGVEEGYFFHALYPALRVSRALGARRSLAHEPPRFRWPHRLAARVLDLEQRLLPAGWYGSSLWGVAER